MDDATFRHLLRTKPDLFLRPQASLFYQSALTPSNVQYARERLLDQELIEHLPDNRWKVVDSLLAICLRRLQGPRRGQAGWNT